METTNLTVNTNNLEKVERNVLVYSPGAVNQKIKFKSKANNYGELKFEMIENGVENLSKMKVVEGRTQLEFVSETSALPSNIKTKNGVTNDLIIILAPSKISNGSISRKELYIKAKQLKAKNKNLFKEMVGNYTNLKTEEIESKLNLFEEAITPSRSKAKITSISEDEESTILENTKTKEEKEEKVEIKNTKEEKEEDTLKYIKENSDSLKKELETIISTLRAVLTEAETLLIPLNTPTFIVNKKNSKEEDITDSELKNMYNSIF